MKRMEETKHTTFFFIQNMECLNRSAVVQKKKKKRKTCVIIFNN